MHSGKLIFAQLMEHLPEKILARCVARYRGNHNIIASAVRINFCARSNANATRDWRIYADFAQRLIGIAPSCISTNRLVWTWPIRRTPWTRRRRCDLTFTSVEARSLSESRCKDEIGRCDRMKPLILRWVKRPLFSFYSSTRCDSVLLP
jgi:hypothetical protein